jgi:argonaute-like protein implicated in RNA metabolism and viral defense
VVAVLVFAVGLILSVQAGMATQAKASKSFVVTYKVSNIEADGKPVVEEIRVQTVKATGEYKLTIYSPFIHPRFVQHLFAPRFEFCAGLPFGILVRVVC